ncbi:peptidoglycan-binding domain-containing protein [Streptomyces sp. CRN 30]|uniref:peptidoglycan-binding domain-containing protein n=1 Tax=Streptomyces sp. CRN 30 TaxID=3075613 RepID=UPI002A841964|nr:peptidoglycan-binding domain-containing protein [Streptomyces sp. CRN 30]
MTAPDETHERDSAAPGGDPPGTLDLRTPGTVATESEAAAGATGATGPGTGVVATGPERGTVATGPETGAEVRTAGGGHGPAAPDEETPADGRRRRPVRTSLIVLVAIVVAAAAGLAASGALGGSDDDGAAQAPTGPSATAKVKRTTLTDSETVSGSIGYGPATTVQAVDGGGSGQGTAGGDGGSAILTWIPEAGDTVERGDNVYSVNQRRTPLLYGDIPFYRTLRSGDSGSDVKILEANLKALGYDGFTADSTYNDATAAAVRQWQDDLNREETGAVEPGDAVVAEGARKVSEVTASTGAAPSGPLLSWTATERVVTVDLEAQYEDLVEAGTAAEITLPDGGTVQGKVTDVGAPSNVSDDPSGDAGGGGADSDQEATLPVRLKVEDQKGLGDYQAASVDVTLESESRKNVLAVPVNALVARDGGGYALEVVKPSAPHGVEYVPVELGLFADSLVEVSGAGISEGTVVGVAK